MVHKDLASQLKLKGAQDRFHGSAPERELVKEQIKLGKAPAEIESEDRVERRAEHLGIDKPSATKFANEVKKASDTRETRRTARPRNPGLERIIGEDDLLSSVFLERGAEAAKSVCCIMENGQRIGTGFLVCPRVLMTNAHVIGEKRTARDCVAEFDFEDRLVGTGLEKTVTFELRPDELFISSSEEELDYTLVAVEPTSDGRKLAEFSFLRLDASVGKVLRGECLNIIQHPNGAPKRVALRQNRFTALLERFMHYEADTMPGSSGSPVFNDQWQVVCLHHAGVPLRDSRGRVLTRDNRVWDGDDPSFIKWIGNEGVRISRIIADVEKRTVGKRSKLLADFPLPVDNPSNDEEQLVAPDGSQTMPHSGKSSSASTSVSPLAVGQGTIAIPLTVSVSIGPAGSGVTVAIDRPTKTHPGADADADDEPKTLHERGLRNLERSQTRVYFDADQDAEDREEYYEGIDPDSDSLFKDLAKLVTKTHATQLSYKVARVEHLYAWVDLQRDKKVRSLYSDEVFDPKKFIDEDFTIERRLEALIEKRRVREAIESEEALERMRSVLEAQEPFNCEHVVPQSWFGGKAPMQGDLHHLFTCQHQCNSFRGNRPYADFGKFAIENEGLRPKCGFSEDGLFEPFMGKGKAARATLYFLLRYRGNFADMYEDVEDGIGTLLEWHKRSKVTEHEKHRNQAIFGVQGNRNPFIDHPEWAAMVFES